VGCSRSARLEVKVIIAYSGEFGGFVAIAMASIAVAPNVTLPEVFDATETLRRLETAGV
jgi:hypothetical protein